MMRCFCAATAVAVVLAATAGCGGAVASGPSDAERLSPSLAVHPFAGEMRYMADAARFTDCRTGDSYPIAMEGAWLELERGYLAAASEPGAPLYVTLDGAIEARPKVDGEGNQPTVVVQRFIRMWPDESCDRARVDASLINTYWRIVRLDDQEVAAVAGEREPHMVLRGEGESPRFAATVGCNQLVGGLVVEGETIAFGPAAATMMACPPPLDELEPKLGATLAAARGWRILGNTLELFDDSGAPLALLQAVYL